MSDHRPITASVTCEAPIDEVWRAISDGEVMPRWYFAEITTFRPEVGFEARFTVHLEHRSYEHVWRVLEARAPEHLVYTFVYEGLPGDARVRWSLEATDAGTIVTVVHDGLHTLPQDDPAFAREAGVGAWDYFLKRLRAYVEA